MFQFKSVLKNCQYLKKKIICWIFCLKLFCLILWCVLFVKVCFASFHTHALTHTHTHTHTHTDRQIIKKVNLKMKETKNERNKIHDSENVHSTGETTHNRCLFFLICIRFVYSSQNIINST
jgi:hypothetical protein